MDEVRTFTFLGFLLGCASHTMKGVRSDLGIFIPTRIRDWLEYGVHAEYLEYAPNTLEEWLALEHACHISCLI